MDRCEIVLYIWDPQPFLAPGTGFEKDNVSLAWGCGWAGWFQDDSSALHLLYTLFLLLSFQLH